MSETSTTWLILVILYHPFSILLIILFLMHLYHESKDTDEKSRIQKASSACTLISILCYTLCLLNGLPVFWTFALDYCFLNVSIGSTLYAIAKTFMYYIFLLRLDYIYATTKYQYKPRNLKIIAVGLAFIQITNIILNFLTMQIAEPDIFDIVDGATFCNAKWNEFVLGVVGIIDIIFCVGFMIAFITPLTKMKNYANSSDLKKAATKQMTLTCCATGSTLIFLLGIGVFPDLQYILIPFELTVNVISLMLMTKYYRDSKYFNYDKLCGCIVCCCNYCTRSKSNNNDKITDSKEIECEANKQ
eukprot:479100_1